MNKKIIYIEKSLHPLKEVDSIIEKIKPSSIEWIDHYKDVLNQKGGNWRVQKRFQSLILARRSDSFYYKASPLTHTVDFSYFYYNTLSVNCLYDCEYCYLQGMFTTPHLVMFINNQDFIDAADALSKSLDHPLYLALSYDTDLPAIEHLYPYCAQWMDYAETNPNITIEIRTKSNRTTHFAYRSPLSNVIFSWSITPGALAKKFEPLTPNPDARLKAAVLAHRSGWPVMLCIDPIIFVREYKEVYSNLIMEIAQMFDPDKLFGISIGTLRMNAQYLANIRKQRPNSSILWYPFERLDGHAFYPSDLRHEMINYVEELLNKAGFKRIFTYE